MTADQADEPASRRDGRQEVAERAELAEAMYHSLVESLPGVTYSESLDDAKTLSISPQIKDMLGYTQDEWMADPRMWVEAMHPDDRDWVESSCAEANASGASWRAEYRMIARNGRVVWVRDVATIVRGENGQPLCWQGVMLDITDLKEGAGSS
jgi:two-component system sensor histidine kinase UhpB